MPAWIMKMAVRDDHDCDVRMGPHGLVFVLGEDELTWLTEALQLNATEEHSYDDEDLDPLD